MVVVSRRIDFFGSTTAPLLAMGFAVGSGIGDDSGEDTLESRAGEGLTGSSPVETSTVPSMVAAISVTSEVGEAVVTAGKLVMSSSEADDDQDELVDVDDDELDRYELEYAESLVVSPVVSSTTVLAPPFAPAVVLPFATVASVITGPADELASETCDVTPTNVSSLPETPWSGVDVVTFGWPTIAVDAGDSTAGVVVITIGEVVSITETLVGEAVLSTAKVDTMSGMMSDERLLVAELDTAELGI